MCGIQKGGGDRGPSDKEEGVGETTNRKWPDVMSGNWDHIVPE